MRAVTSIALFMVTLDNLVVTTALPVIRRELDASLHELEWTINAYTLTFAALLLTGAALGDRFGRRRGVTFQAALTHPEVDLARLRRAGSRGDGKVGWRRFAALRVGFLPRSLAVPRGLRRTTDGGS